jgi:hypothetical protein
LGRATFGGLDARLLIGPREVDIGGVLALLFNFGKLGSVSEVSTRILREHVSTGVLWASVSIQKLGLILLTGAVGVWTFGSGYDSVSS